VISSDGTLGTVLSSPPTSQFPDALIAALLAIAPTIASGHELLAETHTAHLKAYEQTRAAYREAARLLSDLRHLASSGVPEAPLPRIPGVEEADLRLIIARLAEVVAMKTIARELHVTIRTIEKRVASLKSATGSGTILQFGIAIAKNGWLQHPGAGTDT